MSSFFSLLAGAGDLIVVVAAFSLIIVIHELGHFVAARWAGIRVLAFAVGFGPALFSYRKGLGWRRGSSEQEVLALRTDAAGPAGERREDARARLSRVASTEYRLNALPFGGYVKMLGQDDADPAASSDAPDSYQKCVPWKRMVVISAGVTANLLTAMMMFAAVFSIGLAVEPARIGAVEPGLPAATTAAINARALGVTSPGLKPGDEVLAIDGEKPDSFNDLTLATAMARKGSVLRLDVRRAGVPEPLAFDIKPREDETTHFLGIGVASPFSNEVNWPKTAAAVDALKKGVDVDWIGQLGPGARLTAVNGSPVDQPYAIDQAVQASKGKPVELTFTVPGKSPVTVSVHPSPSCQREIFHVGDTKFESLHLLGLMPVLTVREVSKDKPAEKSGLLPGDVFVQLGSAEWPSIPTGIAQIRQCAGKTIAVSVLRKDPSGAWKEVSLGQVPVDSEGRIGFVYARDSTDLPALVGRFPARAEESGSLPSGVSLPIPSGSRIVSINNSPVANFADIREALKTVATASPGGPANVKVQFEIPVSSATTGAPRAAETISWAIPAPELDELRGLTFESPPLLALFKPDETLLKGSTVSGAIAMGFKETRRVMTQTYVTFARLFQGSVKVEHLKGPVGIAHVGVVLLDRGWTWLLFFMALISVNLSVINFLPIPIADGGHMVYLLYEQATGRPPPIAVQNAAALAGIIVLGAVFLLVTFHDVGNVVRSIFGG